MPEKLLSVHCCAEQVYNQYSSHFLLQKEHKYIGTLNHKWLSMKEPVRARSIENLKKAPLLFELVYC